ncbi:hypothetical protein PC129_g5130 [Phytophthora cactorum]|uniref:Uncharacterized protein n=1 Tax=Phytophthora cactorum TaxID=29920 RepID=A0A8T1IKT1_9STRA|nr:hypothetical protein PC129_g5130 [Phytophthora cactorum]
MRHKIAFTQQIPDASTRHFNWPTSRVFFLKTEQRVLGRLPPVDPVGGIRSVPRALYAKHYWPKDKSGPLWQHAPEMSDIRPCEQPTEVRVHWSMNDELCALLSAGNSSMTDSHHKI